jgi:AraC-like DNA-binding protein
LQQGGSLDAHERNQGHRFSVAQLMPTNPGTIAGTTANLHFDVSVYSGGVPYPRHRHDELQLSLILRGAVSETVRGLNEIGRALSVVSKDSGLYHADDFPREGAKIARLSLPKAIMNDLLDGDRRIDGWKWTHDPRIARPFLSLVRRAKDQSLKSFAACDPDVIDLLAAFTARAPARDPGEPPAWLRQTMTDLRDTWRPGMKVSDVAHRAGVHPVYLARCVRRWYGTGIGNELRRLRLASTVAMLTQGKPTVSSIAHANGYSDEPHFCRATHQMLGMTPRRLRSLVDSVA